MLNDEQMEIIRNLGLSLMDDGILLTGIGMDSFTCIVERKERSDEEIETVMRQAKVKVMMSRGKVTNNLKDIKLRYKIVTHDEYLDVVHNQAMILR